MQDYEYVVIRGSREVTHATKFLSYREAVRRTAPSNNPHKPRFYPNPLHNSC